MCMANLAAMPGNMIGSLWGEDDFGESRLGQIATNPMEITGSGHKISQSIDKSFAPKPVDGPAATTAPNQVKEVSAMQRRGQSLLSN